MPDPTPATAGQAPLRLLLVEDDEAVRRALQLQLHWLGYEVLAYGKAGPIVRDPPVDTVDVLVVDYWLPDGDGLGVLRALRRAGWRGRAILITSFPDSLLIDSAIAGGFDAVLEKPMRPYELARALAG